MNIGDRVLYVPAHAGGKADHPDCEPGIVTGFNHERQLVFVRYGADGHSKATPWFLLSPHPDTRRVA